MGNVYNIEELKNYKYGRLTIIKELPSKYRPSGQKIRRIRCKCDCGNYKDFDLYEVIRKNKSVKSCGCLNSEISSKQITEYNKTRIRIKREPSSQAKENTRLKNIFHGMMMRCYSQNSDSYKYYGEKGIKVCQDWHEFRNFKEWALNNGYSAELSLDRIDNAKNYEPDNCKWSTKREQANHTSRNVYIKSKSGEIKTVSEWSRIYNFRTECLTRRFKKDSNQFIEDIIYPKNLTKIKTGYRVIGNPLHLG